MRYFRKYEPRQNLMMSNGAWLRFPETGGEHDQWGLLATQDGGIIREIELAQQNQKGGIEEITAADYEALKKKERKPKRWPHSNEAISPRTYLKLREQWAGISAGRAAEVDVLTRDPKDPKFKRISRPEPVSTFRPASVKR